MIVFLILAWLHSRTGVDCNVLSRQMTSIWTASIWHAFIYVRSRKTIFRWNAHFLHSLVRFCFWWSVLDFWGYISKGRTRMFGYTRHGSIFRYLGAHNSTPMCLFSLSLEWERSGHVNITSSSSLVGIPFSPTFHAALKHTTNSCQKGHTFTFFLLLWVAF